MFRVVLPPIIRSAYNCIYSIWYMSHRYCYLPLSWKSWNRFECAVGTCRAVSRHKLCNVASCWIYIRMLLRAQYILHISRIRIKVSIDTVWCSCLIRTLKSPQTLSQADWRSAQAHKNVAIWQISECRKLRDMWLSKSVFKTAAYGI